MGDAREVSPLLRFADMDGLWGWFCPPDTEQCLMEIILFRKGRVRRNRNSFSSEVTAGWSPKKSHIETQSPSPLCLP